MSITDYIKDKLLFIFVQGFVITFICFLLSVLKLNLYTILFVSVLLIASNIAVLMSEYFRKNSFYKTALQRLESLDKKYLLSEMLDEPGFIEGRILYEILKGASKSMNDNIAAYSIASAEYREYIETWVHEIKTPIAAGKLIIENNKSEITKSLDDELSKIDAFVEQALFYSRSSALEKDYVIKEIILSDVVKNVLKKHSKALIESRTAVSLDDLNFKVFADMKWLDFILGQIISNSIKYRTENPKLIFQAHQMENSILLIIEDNGIGICDKDLKRVFDKGFTGENGRKFARTTGIGLYLCKKLCDKMGLGIDIGSDVGTGTNVKIIFPKSKVSILES